MEKKKSMKENGRAIVAFDTNMLLNIARFKVDVFAEAMALLGKVDFVVPDAVERELSSLAGKGARLRKEVAIAKGLMAKNHVKVVKTGFSSAD